jgi:hypothetical protein
MAARAAEVANHPRSGRTNLVSSESTTVPAFFERSSFALFM